MTIQWIIWAIVVGGIMASAGGTVMLCDQDEHFGQALAGTGVTLLVGGIILLAIADLAT